MRPWREPMHRPGHNRVILDLALDQEPICGWVQAGQDPPRRFTGWLSLSAALDGARCWAEPGDPACPAGVDRKRPGAGAEE